MKRSRLYFASLLLISLFTFNQCKKNNNDAGKQLPPQTTTGAMTFGCKIDGKVFLPKDGNGHPGLYVQYVNLGLVPDGGWHLNIPAYNYSNDEGISIETDSLLVEENNSYDFKNLIGHCSAFYRVNVANGVDVYYKEDNDMGSLYITRHDKINRILSGSFSFVGTNSGGQKINITDGRFDIRY